MSEKHKAAETEKAYFVTFTITKWQKVLDENAARFILVDAIRFCQQNRGLILYAYCIMSTHVHLICQSDGINSLSAIIRDLKKHTAKAIVKWLTINKSDENQMVLELFENVGRPLKRVSKYKVWQDGFRPMALYTNKFIWQKLDYIHKNPVYAGLVENPEDYFHCSARNYAGLESALEVAFLVR